MQANNHIKLFTPGSVANISCGFDVLGFCLDPIGDLMQITKTTTPGISIGEISGEPIPENPKKNIAAIAAEALLKEVDTSYGFRIDIEKRIKPGSGIGSSAASAAGAVYGINKLLGSPYTNKELIRFAMEGEAVASGDAHADNLAPVLLGGFTLVRCNDTLDVIKLPNPQDLVATVIHPQIELKTLHSRAILKATVPLKNAIQQWGNLGAFVSALYTADYDLLSRSMEDHVIEPYRAMLIPKFEEVRSVALAAGALGSGISGSGPSIFALSKGMKTAKSVGVAMGKIYTNLDLAHQIHYSVINTEGIKIVP